MANIFADELKIVGINAECAAGRFPEAGGELTSTYDWDVASLVGLGELLALEREQRLAVEAATSTSGTRFRKSPPPSGKRGSTISTMKASSAGRGETESDLRRVSAAPSRAGSGSSISCIPCPSSAFRNKWDNVFVDTLTSPTRPTCSSRTEVRSGKGDRTLFSALAVSIVRHRRAQRTPPARRFIASRFISMFVILFCWVSRFSASWQLSPGDMVENYVKSR